MGATLSTEYKFTEFSDEQEYANLIKSIRLANRYFLHFVCCNHIAKQDDLIKKVKKSFPSKTIKHIHFRNPISNLLSSLEKEPLEGDFSALFVTGLQNSVSSSEEDENSLIKNLNITRDSFRKLINFPIYLWIPEYAITKIAREAPDFFSVRSGIYYFSSSSEELLPKIERYVSRNLLDDSSESRESKLRRLKSLEEMFADFRSLPSKERDFFTEQKLLSKIGNFHNWLSDNKKAIDYYEQALVISREIGDRQGEGNHLGNLGIAYLSLGKKEKACGLWNKSIAILEAIESPKSNTVQQWIEDNGC